MYCKKCGRFIAGNEELCEDCLHNELVFGEVNKPQQPQQSQQATAPANRPRPRMLAFKPALAAVITGTLSYMLMLMAFIVGLPTKKLVMGYEGVHYTYVYSVMPEVTWVLFSLALPLCVVALVFGIRSLVTVVKAKKSGAPMAIAPLIISISAIVMAGLAVLFGFLTLIALAAAA